MSSQHLPTHRSLRRRQAPEQDQPGCRSVQDRRGETLGLAHRQEGELCHPLQPSEPGKGTSFDWDPYLTISNLGLISYLASTTHYPSPQASRQLEENPDIDHEYLPITGLPQFTKAAQGLIFGKQNKAVDEGRVIR